MNMMSKICTLDGRCRCPICGVIRAMLTGAVRRRNPDADTNRIAVLPANDEASYPYLARVMVDDCEIYRVYRDSTEVLLDEVIADVMTALEKPQ